MFTWLILTLACTLPAGETYPLTGTVLEVHEHSVLVDHEAVEGLMGPMAMAFDAEPALLRELEPGDEIRALLLVSKGSYRLAGLEVTGHHPLRRSDLPPPAPLRAGEVLPALSMPTTSGTWTLGADQGTPTALTFLFTTCPDPEACPLLATKLAALQARVAGRARILAVTLDPDHDSLEVLAAWGGHYGADPDTWAFGRLELDPLTGLLARAGVNRLRDEGPIAHNLALLVLDAKGRLVLDARDNNWDPDTVAAALTGVADP